MKLFKLALCALIIGTFCSSFDLQCAQSKKLFLNKRTIKKG
jgi:hypothetical protein